MRVFDSPSAAYLYALEEVYFHYDHRSSPRGLPVREKLDYGFRVVHPSNSPIITNDLDRNKVIEEYTQKEMKLYDSCSNLAEDFGKASKFWLKLANPDGTVNSAYGRLIWANKSHGNAFEQEIYTISEDPVSGGKIMGYRPKMRTPWEWCRDSLIADKDTRQAIMRFSLPEHQWMGNKDQTCTLHGNWLIRNDRLHFSVTMRSNDLVKGLVYDMPWFCGLMDKMVEELKPHYPNLTKGYYTHIVHSLHIYEKDEETIVKMLGLKNNL
jgi:hypothetical protein